MKPYVLELDDKIDTTNEQQPKVFNKFLRAPIQCLTRARDCYVNSMNKWAGMGNYTGIVAAPGPIMTVPISFSSNSSSLRDQDDDYRELMKAASEKERAATKLLDQEPSPRSLSTPTDHNFHIHKFGVGRIDEESPCYFSGSFNKTADKEFFPRSQSCSTVQKYV